MNPFLRLVLSRLGPVRPAAQGGSALMKLLSGFLGKQMGKEQNYRQFMLGQDPVYQKNMRQQMQNRPPAIPKVPNYAQPPRVIKPGKPSPAVDYSKWR